MALPTSCTNESKVLHEIHVGSEALIPFFKLYVVEVWLNHRVDEREPQCSVNSGSQ